MAEYFRRRALIAAVVVALVSAVGVFVIRADAPFLFGGLMSQALPVLVVSVACGIAALMLLLRGAARGGRLAAVFAVAFGVLSWGVAQWPYLLPQSLTFQTATAPSGTLTAVLLAVALAVLLVVPGFVLLYVLDQRGLLPEEGVADADERSLKEI